MNEDVVNSEWLKNHNIVIPFADGVYQSAAAVVKVSNGVVTHAQEKDATILAALVQLHVIDLHHMESALLYMGMRESFNQKSSYKISSLYYDVTQLKGEANEDVERAYEYINKELGKRGVKIIEFICSNTCQLISGLHSDTIRNTYRQSLEILLKASDDIWKVIYSEK